MDERQQFLKLHGTTDRATLAILSWKCTSPSVSDVRTLPTLLADIRVPLIEVCADPGYLSSANAQLIVSRGATPYIKPKVNTKGRPKPGEKDRPSGRTSEEFRSMVERYQNKPFEWHEHYRYRVLIESSWSGLKRRFGHAVAALTDAMRRIEAGLRVIVWNLTRVTRP